MKQSIKTSTPKFALCHQNIFSSDSIGQDIIGMYSLLEKMGLDVTICGESIDSLVQERCKTKQIKTPSRIDADILIYHHSRYWKIGEQIARYFSGEIIFKYHRIIPSNFFEPYSYEYKKRCQQGNQFTKKIIDSHENHTWLTNSECDSLDLVSLGLPKSLINVVPPFNKINPTYIPKFLQRTDKKKLIFVGEFTPNHGHRHLLKILEEYVNNFSKKIELQLVGTIDPELQNYFKELVRLIARLKLEKHTRIFTNVPTQLLNTFYQQSDIFIYTSEYDGFCVSALEAQSFGIPVIASNTSAIPEILGNQQPKLKLPETRDDYKDYACLVNKILDNQILYDQFSILGINNVTHSFLNHRIESKFIKSIYPTLEKYI